MVFIAHRGLIRVNQVSLSYKNFPKNEWLIPCNSIISHITIVDSVHDRTL